jgi:diguanylate cyclase (GGDEF)-like protein/putative nucleotidyltransferase with HDIG domain
MSIKARLYIGCIAAIGSTLIVLVLAQWQSHDLFQYLCYFAVALCAAGLKVRLPGVTTTMSVNFLFILFGIIELSLPETMLLGCAITAVQCLWNPKRHPKAVQVIFNVTSMAIAIAVTDYVYHSPALRSQHLDATILLVVAAVLFFGMNTFPVAAVISLTEAQSFRKTWYECYFWSFPYYLVGAAIAGLMSAAKTHFGWQTSLLVIPVVYLIYRSYCLYLGRLEDEKKHAEEMAALHLRTIEALALAIEAKDHTTHDHLQRVQVYAIAVGKELGLSSDEIEALRAASLLHDIGKLAIPEHIISKPGRLTPEEFEKMKIHPVVGAEILERVQFPYDVVPIVRYHHEKWDGSGYPSGISGEAIPIGARILSAVDCLDALASDRQYRRALPLDEAMQKVVEDAGKSFDPRVVDVLKRRYVELEKMAQVGHEKVKLSTDMKITKGLAPAAGFESSDKPAVNGAAHEATSMDFLHSIAAARQEVQALFELAQDLGNSLSLDETLSVLAQRLRRMIPWDSMAIYVKRDKVLVPEYVTGDDFRLFSSLEIPMGQGLSGWVAENRKPIVNGNPSVEPGYLNDSSKFSKLRSAVAVPLEGLSGVLGVLSLYHAEKDAFTKDHLRILLAISSKVSLSIENALRYRQAESSATTDYLTGLPNARSLFLHLDGELARCRRTNTPLAVLVCDLDGFKQVNDRFGHLEGNKVLRAVARGLKETCREYDYVARMGGDEFVLVLPGLKTEAIHSRLARFQAIAIDAGREVCGTEIVNISIGEACYPDDGPDAEQLLAEADRRMYKEKQANKIRMAAPARDLWSAGVPTNAVQ